jgi:cytochrome c-type biogenesis protein CcmF
VFNSYVRGAVPAPAVHTGLFEDVFVALSAAPGEQVDLNVMVFPLMWLLWAGGLIVVAGGMWAIYARKPQRRKVRATADV